jgi:RNA polymerase sigma-70 factor (subfamily 1)
MTQSAPPEKDDTWELLWADMMADGSPETWDKLFDAIRPWVKRLAQGELPPWLWAKISDSDLAQEILVTAHLQRPQCHAHELDQWLAWLGQIIVSVCRGARRKYKAKKRDVNREVAREELSASDRTKCELASDESPEEQAQRPEQEERIHRALATLPKDYQRIIGLRMFVGWSFPEIAEYLGRSEKAAYSLWQRAMEALANAVGQADPISCSD